MFFVFKLISLSFYIIVLRSFVLLDDVFVGLHPDIVT